MNVIWWPVAPVLLPGKSQGRGNLVGCSPWGREESDKTEWLHFHFSLSCIGEGNGNPLQCSCLENPRDGRAWWAVIYGVAQSRTRLKWVSSSFRFIHLTNKIFSKPQLMVDMKKLVHWFQCQYLFSLGLIIYVTTGYFSLLVLLILAVWKY